jgi:hypothetical protein
MRVLLLAAVAISIAGCAHAAGGALPITAGAASSAAGPRLSGLRVTGNELVDGSNNVVHLRGVNRSGTEYACVQGWGIFDGLSTPRRSTEAIRSSTCGRIRRAKGTEPTMTTAGTWAVLLSFRAPYQTSEECGTPLPFRRFRIRCPN